jgi:hypothetical protein
MSVRLYVILLLLLRTFAFPSIWNCISRGLFVSHVFDLKKVCLVVSPHKHILYDVEIFKNFITFTCRLSTLHSCIIRCFHEKLRNLYQWRSFVKVVKCRRLRWSGRGETVNLCKNFVRKPLWKRPLYRPWRRWEDNIKTYVRDTGLDGWNLLRVVFDRLWYLQRWAVRHCYQWPCWFVSYSEAWIFRVSVSKLLQRIATRIACMLYVAVMHRFIIWDKWTARMMIRLCASRLNPGLVEVHAKLIHTALPVYPNTRTIN